MKYIEKLLKGAEVKWMTVEEISKNISSGGTPRSNVAAYYGGNIPWLRTQEVNFREIWDTGIKITEEGLNSSSAKYIPANCIIVAMYGATVGRVGINKIPLTTNQACANIEVNDNIAYYRYIYHYLSSQYEYIKSLGAGSQTNINAGTVKKIKVPIPPLYVQEEIVRILDKFTTLEAELDCRKRQYEYYRNQLLSFDMLKRGGQKLNNIEMMTLGEIAEYSRTRISSSDVCENTFVGVDNLLQNKRGKTISTHVPTEGNLTAYQMGDVLIGNIRPYLKKIWQADNNGGTSGDVLVIHLTNKNIIPRYLYQVLADDMFFTYNMQYAKGAKMPRGNKQKIMEYKITIPSLAEQQRIVSILDKFEALTTSISEGLPKEIELRRKQYEYYRNQLLSFA